MNELVDTIAGIIGRPAERVTRPPRTGDVRASWADVSAARRVLGYEPRVGLEEGLRRTIEAFTGAGAASAR